MLLLGSSSCQSSCCLHSKCKTFDMRLVEQWEQGWSKKSLSGQLSLEDRKTKAGGRKELIYETSKMRLTISFYAVKRDGLLRVKVHILARDRFISTTPHKENHKTLTFPVHWLSIGGESLKSSQTTYRHSSCEFGSRKKAKQRWQTHERKRNQKVLVMWCSPMWQLH